MVILIWNGKKENQNAKCDNSDIVFPDLELWTDDNDNCDSVYAFFVVDWIDNDE